MSHTINYEHEVKDQIFFMHKNKITEGEVKEVQITIKKSQFANSVARIIYQISYIEDGNHVSSLIAKPSEDVFATKQELLDSLWLMI